MISTIITLLVLAFFVITITITSNSVSPIKQTISYALIILGAVFSTSWLLLYGLVLILAKNNFSINKSITNIIENVMTVYTIVKVLRK